MKLLVRNRIGIIFRAFAAKESQIDERSAMVNEAIKKALGINFNGQPIFRFVDIFVPTNPAYPSVDCGKMVPTLRKEWLHEPKVRVYESNGDLFSGTLNLGIAIQTKSNIDYSLIASPDAHSYLTQENVMAMLEKADKGARIVGLEIHELSQSIKQGKVANTMCLWDNVSLTTVGCFNLLSSEPENDKRAHYLEGADENGNAQFYKINGVEEVIPAALMAKQFGPCIATVTPIGDEQRYEVVSDPEVQKRHNAKMATKNIRQIELLSYVGLHPSILENRGLIK